MGMKIRILLIAIWGVPVYFWRTRSRSQFWRQLCGLWLFVPIALGYYGGWYAMFAYLKSSGAYGLREDRFKK